jgi:hypothetical protein
LTFLELPSFDFSNSEANKNTDPELRVQLEDLTKIHQQYRDTQNQYISSTNSIIDITLQSVNSHFPGIYIDGI